VGANKEVLIALRTNFDKPEIMKEQFKRLQSKSHPSPSMLFNLFSSFASIQEPKATVRLKFISSEWSACKSQIRKLKFLIQPPPLHDFLLINLHISRRGQCSDENDHRRGDFEFPAVGAVGARRHFGGTHSVLAELRARLQTPPPQ
jgi:hypothetical protein